MFLFAKMPLSYCLFVILKIVMMGSVCFNLQQSIKYTHVGFSICQRATCGDQTCLNVLHFSSSTVSLMKTPNAASFIWWG